MFDTREHASSSASGVVFVLLGALSLSGALGACSSSTTPVPKEAASATVVQIPVEGMSCAACAASVKKTLTSIGGVTDVEVSLVERRARVRFDASRVSPEQLVAAIKGLGYKAGTPAESK